MDDISLLADKTKERGKWEEGTGTHRNNEKSAPVGLYNNIVAITKTYW